MRLVTVDCATYNCSAVRVKFFSFESRINVLIASLFIAPLLPALRAGGAVPFEKRMKPIKIIYFINCLQKYSTCGIMLSTKKEKDR